MSSAADGRHCNSSGEKIKDLENVYFLISISVFNQKATVNSPKYQKVSNDFYLQQHCCMVQRKMYYFSAKCFIFITIAQLCLSYSCAKIRINHLYTGFAV